jgi:hypothetical protein
LPAVRLALVQEVVLSPAAVDEYVPVEAVVDL